MHLGTEVAKKNTCSQVPDGTTLCLHREETEQDQLQQGGWVPHGQPDAAVEAGQLACTHRSCA